MDLGSLLLGLALLLVVAFVVARPLVEKRGVRERSVGRVDELIAQRETILNALRELDFDHATGKITDEDYAPQRVGLVTQGTQVLKQLDALGAAGTPEADGLLSEPSRGPGPAAALDEIEMAVAARRRSRRAPAADSVTCPSCRATAAAGDKFCPACGAPLARACPECGHLVRAEDRFCPRCGARLVVAEARP